MLRPIKQRHLLDSRSRLVGARRSRRRRLVQRLLVLVQFEDQSRLLLRALSMTPCVVPASCPDLAPRDAVNLRLFRLDPRCSRRPVSEFVFSRPSVFFGTEIGVASSRKADLGSHLSHAWHDFIPPAPQPQISDRKNVRRAACRIPQFVIPIACFAESASILQL